MYNRADLELIHRFCTRNRELLARSAKAGCFYCNTIFPSSEISTWIPEVDSRTRELGAGVTAACPYCAVDSVLPSAAPIQLDLQLLEAMNRYWF
jgi:hypothetical protein